MDRRDFLKGVAGAAALAVAANASAAEDPRKNTKEEKGTDFPMPPGRMTVAAVGDCILTRSVKGRREPELHALMDILRDADCTWGNSELVIADPRQVYPMPKGGDPHTIGGPWVAEELAWSGINVVGTANNHIVDFGYEGVAITLENLERAGLVHAGSGSDLAQATRPSYFEGPAGRVGQVNCCSTFPNYFAASPAHPYLRGRAGLSPLSLQYTVQVERDLFDRVKKTEKPLLHAMAFSEYEDMNEIFLGKEEPDRGFFFEMPVKRGDKLDVLVEANPKDVERITGAIRIARNNSRIVLATLHAHEAREKLEIPAPFLQPFARACIDAGADAFLAAGPHVLRGMEIYKGKPIFYCLGNFFFQHETIEPIPAEGYAAYGLDPNTLDNSKFASLITTYAKQRRFWESFVPVMTYEGRDLVSIGIHPVVMGFGRPIYDRGVPLLARGPEARAILERFAELSRPYGTKVAIDGDVAHIDLTPAA